jgi:catechol 2,3-dioxygenase-like lactoylglutathione lyase family enzyme
MKRTKFSALAGAVALGALAASSAAQPPPSAEDLAHAWGPIIEGAHFHHVHLNVTDVDASLAFYPRHFDAQVARFAGEQDAIWAQRGWLLFNRVNAPPASQDATGFNHFGWGAPDVPAEYARQQALGATFATPLSDISTGLGGEPGQFHFMYVLGPDGERIEINTDADDNFGHIHLYSADAIAAGAWWHNMFGLAPAPPYFGHLVIQTGAGRTSRQFFDNVNFIIAGREGGQFASTRGTVTDHIGVSVPDLDAAMAAVAGKDITVLEGISPGPCAACRHAFIEGPDKVAIELIEDPTAHPPVSD